MISKADMSRYLIDTRVVLTQYLKDNKGMVATIVAVKTDDGVKFGFSKYHRKMESRPFTKKIGRHMAIERALESSSDSVDREDLPFIVQDNIDRFSERCQQYFKIGVEASPV